MGRPVKAVGTAIAALHRSLVRDDVLLLASSIAYTAILSFFPLLIGLIALLGRFVEQARARQAIVNALAPFLPPGVVSLVWGILEAAMSARGTASAVAIVGLFWAATAVASALRHSLNRVLGAPRPRSFWHRKAIELAMVALGGGLMSLSLILSTLAALVAAIPALEPTAQALRNSRLATAAAGVGPWILSGAAFFVIYRFLPNVRLHPRSLLAGSLAGVVLFETTKQAFFWYLRTLADYPLVYSHLAGVVVFMIWVYLVALVLLVGAEITAFLERGRQVRADAL